MRRTLTWSASAAGAGSAAAPWSSVVARPARLAGLVLSALTVLGVLGACGEEAASTDIAQAIEVIQPALIRSHIEFLSDDRLRGRDTDDVGYEMGRDYVAEQYGRIGLEPAFDGSYLQPFDLLEIVEDRGSRLRIGEWDIAYPEASFTPDWIGARPSVSGRGVYVGRGLVDGEMPSDADLEGSIAFVLAGIPEGREQELEVVIRARTEVELAYRRGAKAVVVVDPRPSVEAWEGRLRPRRPLRVLADGTTTRFRAAATLGPIASQALLDRWSPGSAASTEPVDLGPVTIEPAHELRTSRSWNVGGLVRGTDPELRDEVVVFTSHLDHVGIGAPDAEGDSIFNGTHDNALGVAKVLAAAEAMVGLEMARSVLFLAVGAEEGGLLGSWYYVRNPVFPMEKTVAAINHDGGLDEQASDDFLAFGEEYSTLGSFLEQAGEEYGTSYERYRIPPFAAAQALLFRSDQYSFLLAGVPAVYLMPGFTVDGNRETNRQAWQHYLDNVNHQQRDNFLPDASWEAPVAMSAMSVYLVRDLANSPTPPQIQPDAPFRKTRASPDAPAFYGDTEVPR